MAAELAGPLRAGRVDGHDGRGVEADVGPRPRNSHTEDQHIETASGRTVEKGV